MILTVLDIIESQYRLIGVLDPGETADADMIKFAMQANNIMMDSWSVQRLMIRSLTTEDFPLTTGVDSYTIGIGQTWNTVKPQFINDAFLRDVASGVDTAVEIYTEDQYNDRDNKSFVQGRPEALYYNPGPSQQVLPVGTVFLYGSSDAANSYRLFITSQKPLTEFNQPTDVVTFDAAYFRALKFNGAVEMYHEYRGHSTQIPGDILRAARESLRVIKVLNSTQALIPLDLPGCKRSSFNFISGDE